MKYFVPLRYNVTEGVSIYSQETWRMVTENREVQLVEEDIGNVVSVFTHILYYDIEVAMKLCPPTI